MKKIIYGKRKLTLQEALDKTDQLIRDYKFSEAQPLAEALVKTYPVLDAGYQMLGICMGEQGHVQKAVELCEKAVSLSPQKASLINALANYVGASGDFSRAEKLFHEALTLSPGLPDAIYNLGKLLIQAGKNAEAEEYLQQALTLAPNNHAVYQNIGSNAFNMKRYEQALLWFKLALSKKPDDEDIFYNIGVCLGELGRHLDAIEAYQHVLEISPYRYETLLRLAYAYYAIQDYKMAELFAESYLDNCPEHLLYERINGLTLLSSIKKATGDQIQAIEIEKTITEEFSDQNWTFSNLLLNMVYTDSISQEELFEWHKKYGERYEKPHIPSWPEHKNTPEPTRKLRIGYTSADFFNHAVSYLSLPLIARHDKTQFEIHCFSSRRVESPVTAQFQKESIWHDVDGKNAEDIFKEIIEAEIDILVDMSGHTGGTLLPVHAMKPAPIQIMWLGYPFTSGLTAIDYRIVDRYVEPEGLSEHLNTEKLFRLDGCFCAYRPSIGAPERLTSGELDVRATPALKNGFVTFGCCNNISKLTDFTLGLWSQLLERAPHAKLLLELAGIERETTRKEIESKLVRNGIALERTIFSNRAQNKQYSLYHDIDIVLDPYPCNGGNTTCDALFMSVPVVSLSGERYMSRIGTSLISNVGHPEWVTDSPERYLEIAIDLASDVSRLNEIRLKLREEVEHSPVMDEVGFARRMEKAYRQVWTQWCETKSQASGNPQAEQSSSVVDEPAEMHHDSTLFLALKKMAETGQWADIISSVASAENEVDEASAGVYAEAVRQQEPAGHALPNLEALVGQYPRSASCWLSFGRALQAAGKQDEAEKALRTACSLNSKLLDAHYLLAGMRLGYGMSISLASPSSKEAFHEAQTLLQHVISLDPKHYHAWCDLSYLQLYRNRLPEAEVAARKALKIHPQHVPSMVNLSVLLLKMEKYSQAMDVLMAAVELAPDNAFVHRNLGKAYGALGQIDKAILHDLQAVKLMPSNLETYDSFLLHSVYVEGFDDTIQQVLSQYADEVGVLKPPYYHHNLPVADRKLRLGIVSGDFQHHSAMYIAFPLLEKIDKSKFELFLYYNGDVYDEVTTRIKNRYADHWRLTRGVAAEVMEHLVRDDGIDILLDLSGHTGYNNLAAFARKPAPIQIAWLGYPATTGLKTIDYVITDNVVFPDGAGMEQAWAEQPWRLNNTAFAVYRPYLHQQERHNIHAFHVKPTPALEKGYITFGSGSNPIRITRHTAMLWSQVLSAVPNAKLRLESATELPAILDLLLEVGIERDRIDITRRSAITQYRFYHDIDIALDLFPSNGGNTSLDTLWMGVPVVTRVGDKVASRIGASILTHLGHPEWIADTDEAFVATAVALAQDVEALNTIRQGLRAEMQASVLMDEIKFVRAFEHALRDMWRAWCDSDAGAMAHEYGEMTESLGLCADLLGQAAYEQAWDGYRAILARWPKSEEAMYGLGMVALLQGNAEVALSLLNSAAHAMVNEAGNHPLAADCLAALGRALLELGRDSEAAPYLRHSLALKESESVREWLSALPDSASKVH